MRDTRSGTAGRKLARKAAEAVPRRRLPPARGDNPPEPYSERMDPDFLARVWRASGLPGKPPPVYQGGIRGWGHMGEQEVYNRRVHLAEPVARGLRDYGIPGKPRNLQALEILLHEYAHVAQPRALRRGSVMEGGAEAWTKQNLPRVLQQLGGARLNDIPTTFPAYRQWTRQMQRNPTLRDYGQFGRRP